MSAREEARRDLWRRRAPADRRQRLRAKDDDQPDAYYIAYSGPYDVDETNEVVAHHVQVSVIPSWLGTTQLRLARFDGPDQLALSTSERRGNAVTSTTTISWTRQPRR
jgi:hypothetical protein